MARSNRKSNRRPIHQNDASAVAAHRSTPPTNATRIVEVETCPVAQSVAPPVFHAPESTALSSDPVTEKLDFLVELMTRVDSRLDDLTQSASPVDDPAYEVPAYDDSEALAAIEALNLRLDEFVRENEELRQQNEDLALQLAQSSVRQSVRQSDGVDESLSWEQRKALIFDQMESNSFDAESFIGQLSSGKSPASTSVLASATDLNPVDFVEELIEKHRRAEHLATRRAEEIEELRMLLHQQAEDRQSGVVIGAAAVAGMIDSDELVQQERARLQELKAQWEEKIRETEINASLERAKLSRERQDLARRASELEAQLEVLQRQQKDRAEPVVPGGRRWLAELGLGART